MASTSSEEFAVVVAYCARWGVEVERKMPPPSKNVEGWHSTSAYVSIYWPSRTIRFGHERLTSTCAMLLLHELSHCLQPEEPTHIDEIESGMFAFERYSVRYLGLSGWEKWAAEYQVYAHGTRYDWSELTGPYKRLTLRNSLDSALTLNLLNTKRQPTFKRLEWMPDVAVARMIS